jgi:prevent-host-death family protein
MNINVHEAKVGLSAYLKRVQQGETVIICNRNVPVAELRAVDSRESKEPASERVLGFARGEFTIPDSFFDPLPDEELDAWEPI